MFIYILEIQGDYPPTLWNHVFQMMSLESFNQLYPFVRFPVKPTKKLQQIAQDFVIAVTKEGGKTIPFEASQDLLSDEPIASKRHQMLFDKTFGLLRQEGIAEEIHDWAMHTQDFYDLQVRDNLSSWCRLMRECAIINTYNDTDVSLTGLNNKQLKQIIDYWMAIWEGPVPRTPDVKAPPLEREKLHKIYNIILSHEHEKIRLKSIMEQVPVGRNWDTLVLDGFFSQGWINIESTFRINLSEWTMITKQLNLDDIQLIEKWGLSHKHNRQNLIGFPTFDA